MCGTEDYVVELWATRHKGHGMKGRGIKIYITGAYSIGVWVVGGAHRSASGLSMVGVFL